jgi:hypothetical protein
MDNLLARGVTCCEVEQLPRRSWFAAPELVDKCFIGRVGDERSDHICIHNVRQLIALLGEVADVLALSFSHLLLAGLEIPGIPKAHVRALEVFHKDALEVCP